LPTTPEVGGVIDVMTGAAESNVKGVESLT